MDQCIALIGGDPMYRLSMACRMRRKGFTVFCEYSNRKRNKMYTKAKNECCFVFDCVNDKDFLNRLVCSSGKTNMAHWIYSGSFLDDEENQISVVEKEPDLYQIGREYVLEGRKWRCEKIQEYP
jgi:hypothetical protein